MLQILQLSLITCMDSSPNTDGVWGSRFDHSYRSALDAINKWWCLSNGAKTFHHHGEPRCPGGVEKSGGMELARLPAFELADTTTCHRPSHTASNHPISGGARRERSPGKCPALFLAVIGGRTEGGKSEGEPSLSLSLSFSLFLSLSVHLLFLQTFAACHLISHHLSSGNFNRFDGGRWPVDEWYPYQLKLLIGRWVTWNRMFCDTVAVLFLCVW